MNDYGQSYSGTEKDNELQEFLMIEKQKAQVTSQIHEFTNICWDMCMDKPSSKMSAGTEKCLKNCVDRFIDTSVLITQRFAQLLQKSAASGGGM